jgi:hypothetical protein
MNITGRRYVGTGNGFKTRRGRGRRMGAATLHVIIVGGSARHSYTASGNITRDRIWTY